MTDVGTLPAAVDGLRQTVAVLRRQNTPDLADIADALERYLNPLADISLDAALGLHPVPGAEHWRTAARRAIRDNELRALVDAFLPGLSVRRAADEVTRLIASYRIRWGRADQHSATMPASYVGRPEQHLYRA